MNHYEPDYNIDGFQEGIIIFEELEDDLNEIEKIINSLKNGRKES